MNFLHENSLFSTILSLYILLFLYFPSPFLQFIFSPVIFSTLILLLYLLRLGASQNCTIERIESDSAQSESLSGERNSDLGTPSSGSDPKQKSRPFRADSFLEWDVRAPLEVIYEEYEGEDAEENYSEAKRESQTNIIQRYASLSLFYPESDSDASSEGDYPTNGGWDSPEEDMCFRWEEDDREGLIEIALDEKRINSEFDEDNLIEIDLSPAR
ncbi:hypothetical protein ACS0TY_031234 [Phlomoides rotata]